MAKKKKKRRAKSREKKRLRRIGSGKPSSRNSSSSKRKRNKKNNKKQTLKIKRNKIRKSKRGKKFKSSISKAVSSAMKIGKSSNSNKSKTSGKGKEPELYKGTKDDIREADDFKNTKYRKYDYNEELEDTALDVQKRHQSKKNNVTKPKRVTVTKKEGRKLQRSTGYVNKVKKRISSSGKLKDKAGQVKGRAPSFDKYKKAISNTQSPYHKQITKITGSTYDKSSRAKRNKERLATLKTKLDPKKKQPWSSDGTTKDQLKKYESAGSHLMKKFSDEKK